MTTDRIATEVRLPCQFLATRRARVPGRASRAGGMRAILQGSRFALVALCMVVNSGFAQPKELRFEVSTIKPLGPIGGPVPGTGDVILPGGWFSDPGTKLRNLIDVAYDVDDLGLKIVGLPQWAEDEGYIIKAKAGPEYPADISKKQNQENVKAMLRSLLADRFHLRIHQEERETDVLVLQAKEGGSRLQAVSAPVPPEKEGRLSMALGDRGGRIAGEKVTLSQFARILSLFLKQRVEDRTGLTGFYDFDGRWEAPDQQGDPVRASGLGPEGRALLVSYLSQELGLVLKSETALAQFWVVDHVEMPDEN